MQVRLASQDDLKTLHALICVFRESLQRDAPKDAAIAQSLDRLLASDDTEFLLALDDSQLAVGYIQQRYRYSLWLCAMEATLEDLFVLPEFRRKSVGTRLIEFAIERAKERGCQAIKLDTNQGNEAAISLYQKLGFTSGSTLFGYSPQLSLEKNLESDS